MPPVMQCDFPPHSSHPGDKNIREGNARPVIPTGSTSCSTPCGAVSPGPRQTTWTSSPPDSFPASFASSACSYHLPIGSMECPVSSVRSTPGTAVSSSAARPSSPQHHLQRPCQRVRHLRRPGQDLVLKTLANTSGPAVVCRWKIPIHGSSDPVDHDQSHGRASSSSPTAGPCSRPRARLGARRGCSIRGR